MDNKLISVFDSFGEIFSRRLDSTSILDIGEDSIRYDFFTVLSQNLSIKIWEMHLEYPISAKAFIPRSDPRSKRKERPQLDLVLKHIEHVAAFEFGLFKRNSNPKGSIKTTENTLKMVNDFIRLGLHSHYEKLPAYFICVADSFMLNHQLDSKTYDPFPAEEYVINDHNLKQIIGSVKTNGFLDERFLLKRQSLKLDIKATLTNSYELHGRLLEYETKFLVWKVAV